MASIMRDAFPFPSSVHCGEISNFLLLSKHLLLIDFCKDFTYVYQTDIQNASGGFLKF